jgi:hypothetical protein
MTRPISGNLVTRDFDNPAFEPFQANSSFTLTSDQLFSQSTFVTIPAGTPVAVPAGKRLVLEFINGRVDVPPGQKVILVRLQVDNFEHCFAAEFQGTENGDGEARDFFVFNHLMRLYVEPGSSVGVIVNRSAKAGLAGVNVVVTGYFVDVA